MKIDINKIEGYADMTAEKKVEVLESYEFAEPDYSGYVKKDVYDRAASEAADWKKKYKETLSEKEKAELEAKELADAKDKELNELKAEKQRAEYKSELIANGYSDELATDTAQAMLDGDMAKVFANQKKFKETFEAELKKSLMEGTPEPGKGKSSKGLTQEQFDAMSYTERVELFNSDRDTYDKFNGGN